MHRILVVEDDERLASVLYKGLIGEGFSVTMATDAEKGFELFQSVKFDLILTDLVLPGEDGIELCKKIRREGPDIPILMLTALGTTDDKLVGFDVGADDYLVKPFDFRELFARIKSLLRRKMAGADSSLQEELRYADLLVHLSQKKVIRSEMEILLTPKEFNLLVFLLRNPEQILSREEIAKEVWGLEFDTGTNFIDVYINYLRKKIDKPFEIQLIQTRPGMGFILQKP
ncbi:DNA-binding response regulator, OmpR family, contains REC and winged-helix (wHTH) domain [Algoriphagus alkaliphilus]|uniref:DNA-binding response regulator, OmpR family, contains REC and winged-helix (WHTH) domain n=1 Tax=Algoriphagus alkaliphilus TaxID=279824 RepID=A0A1G5YFW7_9BACT|nr:response regulator transcription factor [Algoriphagus alkaliphilus]SDA81156.1 DNA-binding response regulator, OmpR family, contains REC and winged-helix (wHTH) domain [Algoriphagus alkaliphilus]